MENKRHEPFVSTSHLGNESGYSLISLDASRNKVYVGCCMIILNPSGDKVLIAKRKKEPDIDGWQIPGGTVDYSTGEDVSVAAVREAFEETGMLVKDPKFLCLMNTFYYGPERPLHVAFVGQAESEEIPPNPEPHKAEDWQWVPLDSLPEGKWFRLSKKAIDFFNESRIEPLKDKFLAD